jgi:hypothetical protein
MLMLVKKERRNDPEPMETCQQAEKMISLCVFFSYKQTAQSCDRLDA